MSLDYFHSCDFCSDYIIDVDGTLYNGKATQKPRAANEIFLLSNTHLSDVRRGASAKCDFCEWLILQWTLSNPGTYHRLLDREDTVLLYATTHNTSGSPQCLIRTHAPIDVFTPEGDVADKFIWNRPINPRIGSPENCTQAQSWLQTCLKSHPSCPKPSYTFMPKRVLRISSDASCTSYAVRISVDNPPAPYVALSYCWGGDQPYKTTKARIDSGQFDLTWEKLPKTIQDAVQFTLSLGMEYLWVDAFCIIQDDDGDFALQMAEVPSIYARSVVTIGASRAATASQGFLAEVNLATDTHLRLGTVFITCIPKSRLQEPIHYRAWTMQEFYLPVGLLQFESYQLRWQCCHSNTQLGFAEQAFADGWKRGNNPNDLEQEPAYHFAHHKKIFDEYAEMGMATVERQDFARSSWESLIQVYTSRRLAYAGDRSGSKWAASGMAEAWATIIHDDYLAGHWRKSLPSGLLWHIMNAGNIDIPSENQTVQLGRRLNEFLGPSWSWTSVLGRVNFLYAGASRNDTRLILLAESVKLTEPKARYGAVKYGYLTAQGRLQEALYYGSFSGKELVARLERLPSDGIDSSLVITKAFPDAIEPEFLPSAEQKQRDPIPVQLLEVGHCVNSGQRGPVGLILRRALAPTFVDSEYPVCKRLGMFHINAKAIKKRPPPFDESGWNTRTGLELSWFNTCESKVITII
ncbi:heterokaryon incompatibility protein-domain-containing protein [Xylariaceae sp. FL1019]|nr:heterokaryon incompatibility protein-domain-containing protein [Xylariaceae sp. FL1019]